MQVLWQFRIGLTRRIKNKKLIEPKHHNELNCEGIITIAILVILNLLPAILLLKINPTCAVGLKSSEIRLNRTEYVSALNLML
jgi:hypothetical protein